MNQILTDEKYMHRCLQLARNGIHSARPNPMVGCVIVADDPQAADGRERIIGEGYHIRCGEGHAEVNAFASVHPSDEHLLPLATVTVQNKYMEAMVGCDTKYYLSESSDHYVSIGAGLHYRWRDAALVQFSLEYNSFIFALLYDANLSKLTPASRSIGSFEMNIVYRLVRNHRVNRKAMPCPII